jgi:chemotaxis signal transduction protein
MRDVHVLLRVGAETYALPVEHVLEVSELGAVEPVPGAPSTAFGVKNLRGEILPVFDLGTVLGVAGDRRAERIVVAEVGTRRAGLAVADVSDVTTLSEELEPAEPEFLVGQSLVDGELVGLLDADRVFELLESAR